jgi:hypothetical protein
MASETDGEKLTRVAMMADGDPKWDLSTNDQEALHYVLDAKERLEAENGRLWAAVETARVALLNTERRCEEDRAAITRATLKVD